MKHMKVLICVFVALVIIMPCSGCLNPESLDEFAYVMSIGVDVGMEKEYFVTLMIQEENPQKEGAATFTAGFIGAEGDNIFEALGIMQSMSPKIITFTRTSTLHFSSDVAKAGKIGEFLEFDFDRINLRGSANLIIVDGNASDFLKTMASSSGTNIGKLQISLRMLHMNEGFTPETNTLMFMEYADNNYADAALIFVYASEDEGQNSKEGSNEGGGGSSEGSSGESGGNSEKSETSGELTPHKDKITGLYELGGALINVNGCALFSGWNMVGILDAEDTILLQMGNGSLEKGNLRVKSEDGEREFYMQFTRAAAPKVELDMNDGEAMRAHVTINLECRQLSMSLDENAWITIKDQIERSLANEISRVFCAVQSLGCDTFGFGRYAAKRFSSYKEWKEYDWYSDYALLDVEFKVKLRLEE